MLIWKKILWLRERIREQNAWIEKCGGDLQGYIDHYGDPGVPPLDNGHPKIITIPVDDQVGLFGQLDRVPGTTDQFFAPHFGDGGTAIYKADKDRLDSWERELNKISSRNHAALQKANEMEKTSDPIPS